MVIAGKTFVFDLVLSATKEVEEETIYDLTGQTLERTFTANGDEHNSLGWDDPPEDFYYGEGIVWNYVPGWYNSDERVVTFGEEEEDITGAWELWFQDNAEEVPEPAGDVYLAEDEDLTAVADAIRLKGGTSAELVFPEGFVTAINNISTGYYAGLARSQMKITGEAYEENV